MTDETIAGRYRLLEQLGRGAMSSVWLAHDDELDRDVAIKLLAPTADRTRFEREARAVAALSHQNIATLYDYGESDGKPFMVFECLRGGTLEDRLARGAPLPDGETERYATEIAAGLAHAHERGLVHRDLKPANVLFDGEGRAKIADFGIARMGDAGTLTEAGTVLGTAAYISPEQAAGLPATAASDVYSFGVILFRMLTGRLPFESANAMELVRMHRDDPPPRVEDVRRGAPAVLAFTTDAALAKDPELRPADGGVLLATLRDETTATMVAPLAAAEATQVIRPAARRRQRSPYLLPLIVVAAVLLLGGAALALALSTGGGGDANTPTTGAGMSLPNVPTASASTASTTAPATTATTAPTTTQATTTAATTTAPTTTHVTTTRPATTSATTTAPTTTAPAPPPPPPPTTTAATTTVDTTTTGTTTTTAADQGTTPVAASP